MASFLFRATLATIALGGNAIANDQHRRASGGFGIGDGETSAFGGKKTRNFDSGYIPPWRDPVPTTPPPTTSPSASPTASPSAAPLQTVFTSAPIASTVEMIESNSTESPTVVPVDATTPFPSHALPDPTPSPVGGSEQTVDSIEADTGAMVTSCSAMPSIGTFVKETLDIDYNLYLDDLEGDLEAIQELVSGSVEPQLHEALAYRGMGCETPDFVLNRYTMVELTSSGADLIFQECALDEAVHRNATACYQVLGQVEATMWFHPQRRSLQIQGPPIATTPFGDREAFRDFSNWMKDAFASIDESASDSVDYLSASFNGFVNMNNLDGISLETPQNVGVIDKAAALMGSAFSQNEDPQFNLVFGLIAVVSGALVLAFVVLVVVVRRRRNKKALLEHSRCVDELRLDAEDDLDSNPDIVDDHSLFEGSSCLPVDYQIQMEHGNHDYRTCANPRCKLCRIGADRKQPIFVATDTEKHFDDHLTTLKNRNDAELREQRYESAVV